MLRVVKQIDGFDFKYVSNIFKVLNYNCKFYDIQSLVFDEGSVKCLYYIIVFIE